MCSAVCGEIMWRCEIWIPAEFEIDRLPVVTHFYHKVNFVPGLQRKCQPQSYKERHVSSVSPFIEMWYKSICVVPHKSSHTGNIIISVMFQNYIFSFTVSVLAVHSGDTLWFKGSYSSHLNSLYCCKLQSTNFDLCVTYGGFEAKAPELLHPSGPVKS